MKQIMPVVGSARLFPSERDLKGDQPEQCGKISINEKCSPGGKVHNIVFALFSFVLRCCFFFFLLLLFKTVS